jgi:hypothetical protein
MQDQWLGKPTTAAAAPLKQFAVAGIVALLGLSYMFNSIDRQVFPALLSAIIPDSGGGFWNGGRLLGRDGSPGHREIAQRAY